MATPADDQQQYVQLTLAEAQEVHTAAVQVGVSTQYAAQGYVDAAGNTDDGQVAELVFEKVKAAVVTKLADRGKVAITRRQMMAELFPNVAGPEGWDNQDDPAVAADVYKTIDGTLWRMVADSESGLIQGRLNSELGLLLCRTWATPDKVAAVYVTRDPQCIVADYSTATKKEMTAAVAKHARKMALAMDRLPDHARRWQRELTSGVKTALDTGTAITRPALEAATSGDEPEGDQPEDNAMSNGNQGAASAAPAVPDGAVRPRRAVEAIARVHHDPAEAEDRWPQSRGRRAARAFKVGATANVALARATARRSATTANCSARRRGVAIARANQVTTGH